MLSIWVRDSACAGLSGSATLSSPHAASTNWDDPSGSEVGSVANRISSVSAWLSSRAFQIEANEEARPVADLAIVVEVPASTDSNNDSRTLLITQEIVKVGLCW
jgi:hypothetical protein